MATAKSVRRLPPPQMGLFDAFKNEDSSALEGRKEGGLSKAPKTVVGSYKGKEVKATVGAKMQTTANALGLPVSYNCQDGQCGTCESKVNGRKTRICVARVPNKDFKLDTK